MALIRPITLNGEPYFFAGYKKNNISSGTNKLINLGTHFESSDFTVSNDTIIINRAGTYRLQAYIEIYTGQSGQYPLSILKNGVAIQTYQYVQSGMQFTYTIDVMITVEANDVISLQFDSLAYSANPEETYYLVIL